ncbi:MAG: sensor histidine kinase [Adhaeribacter sp.]
MNESMHHLEAGHSKFAALYQIEKLNQVLFNNFPDATYILNLEGKFLLVNEQACRLTGLGRNQLLGTSFGPLINPEHLALTRENFYLATQDQPQQYETAILTPEGLKHLDITNFPLKVEGRIEAIFGIAKDITGRKQRELDLQKYAALLQTRNEELEVFRKIIAHDMRKPVNNAIGFAQLLDSGLLPAGEEKPVLSQLLQSALAVDAMIRDLNEVIALKSAGKETKEQVSVAESVQQVLASFGQEIKDLPAAVSLDIAPDLNLFTVKAYFISILRNLVSNALKYHSRTQPPSLQVTAALQPDDTVLLKVKDNGIGMDLGQVSGALFKMYRRFAPALAEGKGLGLYLVHQQVALLGGSIGVVSSPGAGTEFTLTFPRH